MPEGARVRDLVRRLLETGGAPEDVCRDCPELLPAVRERWAQVRALDAELDAVFPAAGDAEDDAAGGEPVDAPLFPGYEVTEPLGCGGMGAVWKAREVASGRLVALKVIHPHLRRLPGFVERLTREAAIGAQVVHENVVRTVGVAPDATRVASRRALVTEYVEGQTLRALLGDMRRVPEQFCRHIGREIANGLAAIHAAGAVHRDLKPDNVLITKDHVVKVMDLGVARIEGAAGNLTDAFVGSLRYAAPEQVRRGGAAVDARADLYALGLTLYELSTGRHAHDSPAARPEGAGTDAPPRRAGELNPQLTPLFEELLARLLETDRERRFASARDVAEVLEQGEESAWWRDRANAIRRATARAPRRIRIARETAIHGRDAELALLRVGFACASKGDGRVILVQGEAGVGKSRLVDEFVATLHAEGAQIHALFGGWAPGGAATPNGAFSEAYREFFGDEDLEAALARRLPDAPALVPPFAALLRGEPPPAALTKDALQTAFARTTQALAEERPTVVVIEDLHLAPEEGRALFAALTLAVPQRRLLLVATARRTLDAKWSADLCRLPHASRLTLRRLGRPELTALLSDALRSPRTAEELVPQIDRKSDGNPFFAFELLRSLRESGLLVSAPGGVWEAKTAVHDIESPSSITDLIAARVADLDPEERELLEVAACCGFEFDPLLVGDVLGLARLPLLRRLGTIESAHRLVRSTGRSAVFDHHQIQEVVYSRLPQVHRETLHAAIAASLERRSGAAGRPTKELEGGLCFDLMSHFLEGGEAARAVRYLAAALDHLERSWKNEAVVGLIDRVLAIPGLLDGRQRAELVFERSARFGFMGRGDLALSGFREAVELADLCGDVVLRAKARASLAGRVSHAGGSAEAMRLLDESIRLWREAGDRKGEAEAVGTLGSTCHSVARFDEARTHQERRLALAREVGDWINESGALAALGNLHMALSEHDAASDCYERASACARAAGDRMIEGRYAGNFANVHWAVGRFEDARALYEVSLARAREAGDRASEARVSGNLANVLWSLGLLGDAVGHYELCRRLQRETGYRLGEAFLLANLSVVLTTLGRTDEALRDLSQGAAIAAEIGSKHVAAAVAVSRGIALVQLGRKAEAIAAFEQAIQDGRAVGDRWITAHSLVGLGDLLAHEGRSAEAVRSFDEAAAVAGQFGLRTVEVAAAAARVESAGGSAETLAALLERHGVRIDATVRLHALWVLGRATGDSARLAEARRLLDFLVAHAPVESRQTMLASVALHRDVMRATGA
jgi:tetratricopeptide (TPR) repeat protein